MTRLSRRRLLQGAGGFTLALPWFESFAAGSTPPRRIVFSFTSNGDHIASRMTQKGETSFVLGEFLQPFEAWRSSTLVIDGVHKNFNRLPAGQVADNHQQGGASLAPWPSGTGSFPIGGATTKIGYVAGPSADRVIGERVRAANPSVLKEHLVFRVGQNFNNIWNVASHLGPVGTQAPIPPETSPFKAYTALFGSISDPQATAVKRRLAMKQSALDLVNQDLNALKPKLSAADRARLEQHTTSVREVEKGLVALQSQSPACAPTALGTSFDVYNETQYKEVGFLFYKVVAMAFACDITRVVNFNWSGNTSDRKYPVLGINTGHHTISHNSDAASFAQIRAIKKHLFSLSTQLHTELTALKEADGSSLYANTLIVNWSEFSQGDSHQYDKDLVVLSGGAQNAFRMGRYLDVTATPKRAFSNLLVSCFQYMGMTDVQSFGSPLLAPNGTGVFPNLA